jgi:hypothetical protein
MMSYDSTDLRVPFSVRRTRLSASRRRILSRSSSLDDMLDEDRAGLLVRDHLSDELWLRKLVRSVLNERPTGPGSERSEPLAGRDP